MEALLNGYTSMPAGREKTVITNPANGQKVDTVWSAGKGDEAAILGAAEKGFRSWSALPLTQRCDILMKYAALLDENRERIAALACAEMGKIIRESREEVTVSAHLARGFVERAKHLYGRTFCDNHPGYEGDLLFTRREPLGVALCVVPFNYPMEIFTQKVLPALVMGNAVIVKAPAHNPLAILEMLKLLVAAGVPPEAVGALYGGRRFVSEKILPSGRIQALSLTGSTPSGIGVLKDSADHLPKVFLELGGNDPLIIFEDADLDDAVENIIQGRLTNTGQTCCASKRFLVQRAIYDALVEKLIPRLEALRRGDPADEVTDIGCLVSEQNAQSVLADIQHTLAQGARCVYGGTLTNKTFLEPTVLVDVGREMDVAKDREIFGPVIPLIPFDTLEEAVDIANQSSYGLQGGVMSRNMMRALRVAEKLQCGGVVVNGHGCYIHLDAPFGGYKMSGIGREGIGAALEEFSQEKTFIVRKAFS